MGQVFSYIWRLVRPKLGRETTKAINDDQLKHQLIDPSQNQSHYITIIPDVDTHHVSDSNPDNVEKYVTDFTPQVPSIVVEMSNVDTTTTVDKKNEVVTPVVEKGIVLKKDLIINKTVANKIGPYNSLQQILLVGEGDFSFSACLAAAFHSAFNITATSYDSEEFLIGNYSNFWNNKIALTSRGATVYHGVDARTMAKDPVLGFLKFDRIIFNFPHAGRFRRTDSELRKHKELIRGFLRSAKKMINLHGEIHITHKTNGFFLEWNIPKIGSDHGLDLIEEVKFKSRKYPGYHTKYGFGGDKDFECNPSWIWWRQGL